MNPSVRRYGREPFVAAVIHGGPGAPGSVAPIAQELSPAFGVIEPIQSKYTVPELIEELRGQIAEVTRGSVALIGHSWGAWLSALFAAEYPQQVNRLVLVGCAPFKASYVPLITQRRLQNLSPKDVARFWELLARLEDETTDEKDKALAELGRLVEKTDNYELLNARERTELLPPDGRMYAAIWPQAEAMRAGGELLRALRDIRCPVVVIHGEYDPHPIEGVAEPLAEAGVVFETHVLPRCGHSPFLEKFEAEPFYRILRDTLERHEENTR